MIIDRLVSNELKEVVPYALGDLMQQKSDAQLIKLDLNENPCVDTQMIKEMMREACSEIDPKEYPTPEGRFAVMALSKYLKVDPSSLYVGNGSDDILDRLTRCFARKDSTVLIAEPSFFMYNYFASLGGAKRKPILLKQSFDLDVEAIINAYDPSISMLFLCSPNNPTGNQYEPTDVERILKEFDGLVVIDEAYADFGGYSTSKWTERYKNLVVLRSFSKAYGLAALRAGYAISSPSVIKWLRKATPPFNVNAFTQKLIEISLRESKTFSRFILRVIRERAWLTKQLQNIDGVKPYPSDANFILFKIIQDDVTSHQIWKKLRKMNILIRDKGSDPLLNNCLRVSVGTRIMNANFIDSLKIAMNS